MCHCHINRILLIVLCLHLFLEARQICLLALKAICDSAFTESSNVTRYSLQLTDNTTLERIALVMRAVDPIQPCLLKRVVLISKTIQTQRLFQNYDFHLLVDQTQANLTNTTTLQKCFNDHNESKLELPFIFGVSEDMIRQEFPELSNGYMKKPLVDGSYSKNPNRPFMSQLMTPAIAVFSHVHQEYDYTWVFEDDVWSLGKPLTELFRRWDDQMRKSRTDLAAFQNRRNGIPYDLKMQGRHTLGFNKILRKMKAIHGQHKEWTNLLARDNQTLSPVWMEWNATHIPRWRCVSDTFYRHSRAFSRHLHESLSKNVYQFAECFQQPLAWNGNLTITDLEMLPLGDDGNASIQWEQGLVNKITRREAIRRHKHFLKEHVTVLLYHGYSSRCQMP